MAVARVRPREISNSRYRMFQRLRVRSLLFRFRKGPTSWHSPPFVQRKKKQTPLPLPFYLFVHTCTRVSVCTYVCDRFRRICNILFCIENDLGAIRVPLEPYAVSFLSVHRGFYSCHRESSRSLRPPRGPGRLPRAKTTCLSIFPVALLRVIKVSSFSLSLFSLSSPPSPFFFSHPILPSSSIWRGLLFPLSLSLTVFLLNDRPFTAVSDDVAGARRFP